MTAKLSPIEQALADVREQKNKEERKRRQTLLDTMEYESAMFDEKLEGVEVAWSTPNDGSFAGHMFVEEKKRGLKFLVTEFNEYLRRHGGEENIVEAELTWEEAASLRDYLNSVLD